MALLHYREAVGVFNAEGPPVPIPNTEVKLCSAENTWLATARENRSMPTQGKQLLFPFHYSSLAQLVEQLTLNQWVPGSNP